ncbi:SDR family oxidoreductase [Nocardia alni]|uniref:SDR family oxidoreductase n=1 Tax=Nocardia alni TaxID=2815723 RepID=UPI001C221FD4|nr:NAD(P)H-binding protein [Nocardia alni]
MTTLVIGARGSIGRYVVEQLLAAGDSARASVRRLGSAEFPAGVSVVEADLLKTDTLEVALHGVRRVFLYAPAEGAHCFVEAASRADLERVVVMSSGSVLLPYAAGNAIAREHRAVEQTISASGLPWLPVRPLVLANNALHWADSIRSEGVVRLVHPEGRTAPIHERDIAAVAVAALHGAPADAILTGPELLSQREQVEIIASAIGRRVHVEEITESRARQRFGSMGDRETVEAILQFMRESTHGGSPATDTVQRFLGRQPAAFADWVADHTADFT